MCLEKEVMDADGSAVLTVPCECISNTLAVGGQLKTEPRKEHDPEQWVTMGQKIEK